MPRTFRDDQERYINNLIEKTKDYTPVKPTPDTVSIAVREAADTNKAYIKFKEDCRSLDEARIQFNKNIKIDLLGECLNKILYGVAFKALSEVSCIDESKVLTASYIKENGADNILNKMRYSSVLLSEMYQLIEKYYDIMVKESNDATDTCCFKVDDDDTDAFYGELEALDTDEIVERISDRVTDAMNDFVTTNTLNKMNIKDVLADSKEKIDTAKSDVTMESVQRIANDTIHSIKTGYNNIFSEMVERTAVKVMADSKLIGSLMEGANLDMKRIINACALSYTLMETVIALQLEPVSESIVLDYIGTIKKA